MNVEQTAPECPPIHGFDMTEQRKHDSTPSENAAWLTRSRAAIAAERNRLKAGETRWSAALVEHLLDSGHLFLIATHQQERESRPKSLIYLSCSGLRVDLCRQI